jgi:CRP/FNR family cyclic AMP-dependent transcriptional regulator
MIDEGLLAKVSLLAGLPPGARSELARRGIDLSFKRGEYLFRAGDPSRGLLLVLEGRVRVVNERDGRRHLVHEDGAGATLGEVPLMLGGGYPASAIAASDTRCLLFSRAALDSAMAVAPEVAWLLLQRMAERVRTLVARLEQRSATPILQSLAELILERSPESGGAVALAATQQELAESLGTVREVIARQLTALRRAGVIRAAGRGRLEVADRAKLVRLAREGRV